jgi:Mg2+-importing ATPase
VVSLLTEVAITFVVRTRGPVQHSRVSPALLWSSAATAALAVALPFSPLGPVFQFVPLPPAVIAALLLLTVAYCVASEAAKRWFYRTTSSGSS